MEKEPRLLEILELVERKIFTPQEALPVILRLFSVVGQLPCDCNTERDRYSCIKECENKPKIIQS